MHLTRVILFRLFDEILHGDPGAVLIGIRKQHRELISPKRTSRSASRNEERIRRPSLSELCHPPMSEAIVNGFEMVQIQPAKG